MRHVPQLPFSCQMELDIIPVVPGSGAGHCLFYRRIRYPPDADQLVTQNICLGAQLGGIGHVLIMAAATQPKMDTPCLDAVRRRVQNLNNLGPQRASPWRRLDADPHPLARQAKGDKDQLPIGQAAECIAPIHQLREQYFRIFFHKASGRPVGRPEP